jgi:hypothetical protein
LKFNWFLCFNRLCIWTTDTRLLDWFLYFYFYIVYKVSTEYCPQNILPIDLVSTFSTAGCPAIFPSALVGQHKYTTHHASCTSRPCIMHACAQRKNLPYKHDACTPTFVRVRGRLAKYSMETEALQASEHSMVTQPPDQNAGSRNCWESAYHELPYPSSRSWFQKRDV